MRVGYWSTAHIALTLPEKRAVAPTSRTFTASEIRVVSRRYIMSVSEFFGIVEAYVLFDRSDEAFEPRRPCSRNVAPVPVRNPHVVSDREFPIRMIDCRKGARHRPIRGG